MCVSCIASQTVVEYIPAQIKSMLSQQEVFYMSDVIVGHTRRRDYLSNVMQELSFRSETSNIAVQRQSCALVDVRTRERETRNERVLHRLDLQ